MKITKIEVENFRLLEDVEISLDKETTLIVGRNNSGKTSLTEIFYKFFGNEISQFTFEDFTMTVCEKFKKSLVLHKKYEKSKDDKESEENILNKEDAYKNEIPGIYVRIYIEYEEKDNLSSLSKFIMDLDPKRKDILISCEYTAENTEKLFQTFNENTKKYNDNIIEFIKRNYKRFFKEKIYAVDKKNRTNKREVSKKEIEDVFLTRFIYAQNQLDDQSTDHAKGLSKGFEDYYRLNYSEKNDIEKIEDALVKVSEELDGNYKSLFKSIFTDLKSFGLGSGVNIQNLEIKSIFEATKIIKGNTQLFYEHGDNLLPEAHNGLGYSKLIFIILHFISFYEEYTKREPKPEFQLIFIEEPEAHLHPQMQHVFIRNIKKFIEDKKGWNVQIVITTHSSHIVSESGFKCIRYFDISETSLAVKNLSKFQKEEGDSAIKFLQQYMSLNRCDMFFADKIILIEGTVERLLLPEMIRRDAKELQMQYISIIEVGGAYAHNFKKLLEFINVKTLIITDIDSVDTEENRSACKVQEGNNFLTSNETLKTWLPKKEKISELLIQNDSKKTDKKIRVAYQIPEKKLKCGRSFEEAFILKNSQIIFDNKKNIKSLNDKLSEYSDSNAIQDNSYEIASKISKKTDFAFDVMMISEWSTPKYIKDGLIWLKQK